MPSAPRRAEETDGPDQHKTGPLPDTGRVSVSQSTSKKGTRMNDPTESIRRQMVNEINAAPGSREALEAQNGKVWDTTELQRDFEALGLMAPLIIVRPARSFRVRHRRTHDNRIGAIKSRCTARWPRIIPLAGQRNGTLGSVNALAARGAAR